ncbi:MAG: flagellar filament capping protein FliD [Sulfuricella sp.]
MALSSPGIGSNLDVNSIVSQLMQVESQPLTNLNNKEASYQAQLSAYGSIKGALSSFQSAVHGLSDVSKFRSFSATSSDSTVASVSTSSIAAPGSYAVNVSKLAQSQNLVAAGQVSTTAAIGSGASTTLTFDFGAISGGTFAAYDPVTGTGGTYSGSSFVSNGAGVKTVSINASNNSLSGIRDAINSAKIGVTASIVNDGGTSPYRLVLSSNSVGKSNSIKISVSGDASISSLLAHDPAATQNLKETVTAQNTEITVNGVFVSKASASVSDVIQGVTLNALKLGATNVSVARDTASIVSAVNTFVTAFNTANKTLSDLSAYNATTKQGAILQGDSTLRSIQSQLRDVLNRPLIGDGAFSNLSQLGVSFQKDGTLAVDSVKLQSAIDNNFSDIAGVFAATGKTSDSLVNFVSSTSSTKPGTYALTVSQLATQGTLAGSSAVSLRNVTGSAAAGLTITLGGNDTLNVTVDGVAAAVTLTAQTYASYAALATEVQTKINAATGKSVTVTNNGGVMSITTNTAAATSQVAVTSGNGVTNLLGALPTQNAAITAGLNDQLSVTVDGTVASVTLVAGTYSAAQLASQVQSVINGASVLTAVGSAVTVAQTAGVMTITSNRYGSASNVSVSGTAATNLLGAAPAVIAGVDAAGTINGTAATGSGQTLTGATASDTEGLKLQVMGGATGGRGTVSFSQGYAYQLDNLLTNLLGGNGFLSSRTDGINRSIQDIGNQRNVWQLRLQNIEARYRAQFTALDTMIGSMNTTSTFLTQQLANLPKIS